MAGSTVASARAAEERVEFPSRRGSRLVGLWSPPRDPAAPVVILCHGMESTKEGTKHRLLVERLAAHGLGTLRFDFSYVGESEGEFADLTVRGEVDDLAGAFAFVLSRAAGPVGLFGSSLGGLVALLFAADEPRVRALAVIAAVAHPERIVGELRPADLDRWRRDGVFSLGGVKLNRAFLDDVTSLDALAAFRRIAVPVLVAHGDADRVVPYADGEEIAAAVAGEARLSRYPGGDHRFSRAEDLERMLDECEAWLLHHLEGAAA